MIDGHKVAELRISMLQGKIIEIIPHIGELLAMADAYQKIDTLIQGLNLDGRRKVTDLTDTEKGLFVFGCTRIADELRMLRHKAELLKDINNPIVQGMAANGSFDD